MELGVSKLERRLDHERTYGFSVEYIYESTITNMATVKIFDLIALQPTDLM
jgi:hypothetical protein